VGELVERGDLLRDDGRILGITCVTSGPIRSPTVRLAAAAKSDHMSLWYVSSAL
jgi:hypothetical protein